MTVLSQVVFDHSISVQSLVTAALFLTAAVAAFVRLRERSEANHKLALERSKANALFTKQMKERLDLCNIEQIKERVDTMWVFQMRRGLAELEKKELGYAKSPIKLTEKANKAIAPLVPKLKQFYQAIDGESMGVIELAVKIEQEFGEVLSTTVCKTIGINDGACLVLAIAQLRPIGPEDIDLSLEKNLGRVHNSMKVSAIPTPLPIKKALLENLPH